MIPCTTEKNGFQHLNQKILFQCSFSTPVPRRSLAVHPSLPYLLSASDDMLIKLWDWDKVPPPLSLVTRGNTDGLSLPGRLIVFDT